MQAGINGIPNDPFSPPCPDPFARGHQVREGPLAFRGRQTKYTRELSFRQTRGITKGQVSRAGSREIRLSRESYPFWKEESRWAQGYWWISSLRLYMYWLASSRKLRKNYRWYYRISWPIKWSAAVSVLSVMNKCIYKSLTSAFTVMFIGKTRISGKSDLCNYEYHRRHHLSKRGNRSFIISHKET